MQNQINVQEIANHIKAELDSKLDKDIGEMLKDVEGSDLTLEAAVARALHLFRENSEQFIVNLLQKVVDDLQNKKA